MEIDFFISDTWTKISYIFQNYFRSSIAEHKENIKNIACLK